QQECVKIAHPRVDLMHPAIPSHEHRVKGIGNVRLVVGAKLLVQVEANQAPVEDDEGNQFYEF
ncbi:MAG: hypothetical protein VB814_12830, partial [Pirellulaceae bacterium]